MPEAVTPQHTQKTQEKIAPLAEDYKMLLTQNSSKLLIHVQEEVNLEN
jgi:hypothetical protein